MHHRYRLRESERFEQVRRQGQSRKDRLVILMWLPNDFPHSRFGFSASRRVGKAVQRNRARRRLREVMRSLLPDLQPGYDVILIARPAMATASFREIESTCQRLLVVAGLLTPGTPLAAGASD